MLQNGQMGYMDAEDLADLADYYSMLAEDDEAADEVIDFAMTLHPDAVEVTVFRARRALREGDLTAAEELASELDADNFREAALLRAEVMVCRKENAHALDYVVTVAATDIDEDLDYFFYDAAYIFFDHGDMDSAMTLGHKLEDIAPDWYSTWELLADIYISEELFQPAMAYVEKMLDEEAFDVETWNWAAEASCGMGDMERAMESVDYALAIDPDNVRARQLKAWLLSADGHPAEAHDIYSELQQCQPDDAEHWLYDVQPLLDTDRNNEALDAARRALQLLPPDAPSMAYAHEMMAMALSANGHCVEALDHVDAAEGIAATDAERAELQLMRVRICLLTKQPRRAADYVAAAQKADAPHAADTLYRAAALFYEYYYDDLALPMFREADTRADTDMQHANCQAYIAACLINGGKKKEALPHLRCAVDMKAEVLDELFAELFPAGVLPADYPDYLYPDIHGRWPAAGDNGGPAGG